MFGALAAIRFLHLAAVCLLFGLASFPYYAYRKDERPPPLYGWQLASAVVALIAGVLEFFVMAANMGDSWRSALDPSILEAAITDTVFGRVWAGRLAVGGVIIVLCARRDAARRPWLLFASGALLASLALTGHAAIPGGIRGLAHEIADAAHLLGAGWWVGGLLALGLLSSSLGDQVANVLSRFSRIGYVAVALIIASGVLNSVFLIASVTALVRSAYGWVLLIKVALVGAMGLLALSNRVQVTPALAAGADGPRWLKRLRTQVMAEFILSLVVLAVVGALGAMAPPVTSSQAIATAARDARIACVLQ